MPCLHTTLSEVHPNRALVPEGTSKTESTTMSLQEIFIGVLRISATAECDLVTALALEKHERVRVSRGGAPALPRRAELGSGRRAWDLCNTSRK